MNKKNALINIGLFITSSTIMLFLAEIAWRIIESPDKPRIFHSQLAMTNKPNTSWTRKTPEYKTKIKTNSYGFRGEEFPEPDENAIRIVFIGDSFLEGKQVDIEERFAEIASKGLEEMLNIPVQAYVLGIGSAHPAHELLYYRHLGREFKPHIVVQAIFPQNDLPTLSENLPYLKTKININNEIELTPYPNYKCNIRCYILKKSRIALHSYRALRKINTSKDKINNILDDPYAWYFAEGIEKIKNEQRLEALTAYLIEMQKEIRKDSAKYTVLVIPGAFEIYEEWKNKYLQQNKLTNKEIDTDYLQNSVVQTLIDNEINVINLKPNLKAISDEKLLYYWSDPHFSKEGNEFVGTLLSKKLYPLVLDALQNK